MSVGFRGQPSQDRDIVKQNFIDAQRALNAAETELGNYKRGTPEYKKALVALNKASTAYDAANTAFNTAQGNKKQSDTINDLQHQLDLASAKNESDKVKTISDSIRKAGGVPYDYTGKEIPGTLVSTDGKGAKGGATTAQPPAGSKVSGSNLVDSTGKVIGTVGKDAAGNPTYTLTPPTTPKVATKDTAATPTNIDLGGGVTISAAPKDLWVSYLKQAFKKVPDPQAQIQIDNIFKQATAPGADWTEQTFMTALNKVDWWRNQLPSLKQFFLETNDPSQAGVLKEQLRNKSDTIKSALTALGVNLQEVDPVTNEIKDNSQLIAGVALDAIKNGWNDNQIQAHLAQNQHLIFTGGGQIGAYSTQIQNQAGLYGINLDKNQLAAINGDLMNPQSTRDYNYWMNEMKNQSIRQYVPFAKDIQEGRTLYQATANYRQQMANLLETDASNITWSDLMDGVVDKNTGNVRTQADFTAKVKQNPLWQYTQNAKDTYTSLGENLMKQFGFVG
jgi:hypothetical protein